MELATGLIFDYLSSCCVILALSVGATVEVVESSAKEVALPP